MTRDFPGVRTSWPFTLMAATLMVFGIAMPASPCGATRAAPGIHYVDLTGEFDRIYERDIGLNDRQRVNRFVAEFDREIPGFYSAQRVSAGDEVRYEGRVLRAFARYPSERAGIIKVSSQFNRLLDHSTWDFERRLGPLRENVPVFLVNSLGELDGGQRDLATGTALIFGADVIARVHANDDLAPLFDHELFHVYHAQHTTSLFSCEEVWCTLWREGLAVYVAQKLNPRATDSELVLSYPEPIRPQVEAHKTEAICAVLNKLDSRDAADVGQIFSSKPQSQVLPPRFGYYVGYLVAREFGRTRTLKQLAALQGPELRQLIGLAMVRMASCLRRPSQSTSASTAVD